MGQEGDWLAVAVCLEQLLHRCVMPFQQVTLRSVPMLLLALSWLLAPSWGQTGCPAPVTQAAVACTAAGVSQHGWSSTGGLSSTAWVWTHAVELGCKVCIHAGGWQGCQLTSRTQQSCCTRW